MTDEIAQLLKTLHLDRIAAILDAELAHATEQDLGYQELLARLLRAQWHHRQESALAWRIKRAGLPEAWTLESFPWKRQPGVSQKQLRGFAELDFVPKAENLVFVDPTGVGKTGLATGLLLKALQNGYRGLFLRAQDLFDEMYASLADRSSRKLLNRLARVDVLCIDEMGYLNLRPEQTNIFFKLMEERYRQHATIITTNLDYAEWHHFLGNKALVDALLSRLRHQCHTVRIDGPSLRNPQGGSTSSRRPTPTDRRTPRGIVPDAASRSRNDDRAPGPDSVNPGWTTSRDHHRVISGERRRRSSRTKAPAARGCGSGGAGRADGEHPIAHGIRPLRPSLSANEGETVGVA